MWRTKVPVRFPQFEKQIVYLPMANSGIRGIREWYYNIALDNHHVQ